MLLRVVPALATLFLILLLVADTGAGISKCSSHTSRAPVWAFSCVLALAPLLRLVPWPPCSHTILIVLVLPCAPFLECLVTQVPNKPIGLPVCPLEPWEERCFHFCFLFVLLGIYLARVCLRFCSRQVIWESQGDRHDLRSRRRVS